MARVYYGLNVGGGIQDVLSQASATGYDVEVSIDTTDVRNELEIKKALENIMPYIQQKRYVPA